ncbi:MAG: hypothetical protein HY078_13680 [Elusimicrobia bacterium]|nr:hypothetical protein [Elusimicrobiota bacterium]
MKTIRLAAVMSALFSASPSAALPDLGAVPSLYAAAAPGMFCFRCGRDWPALDAHLKGKGVADERVRGRLLDVLRQREAEHDRLSRERKDAQAALDRLEDSLSRSGLRRDLLPMTNPAGFAALVDAHRRTRDAEARFADHSAQVARELQVVSEEIR